MTLRLLHHKDLQKIHRVNIVDYILEGVAELEEDIAINKLSADLNLVWATSERKIQVHNLILLLDILVMEARNDPLTGKIILEAEPLLELLRKLNATFQGGSAEWLLGRSKITPQLINQKLNQIISYLEMWKEYLKSKLYFPPGNVHTRDTYHPQFYETYKYKPADLPDDYRSNFFFEVHIKELCPFTTTLLFHPYAEAQYLYQETRPLAELARVDINVDLRDPVAYEQSDNLRALRVPGPTDDKKFPGSYLVLRGGHHRTRAIFKRYIEGKVDGNIKILLQFVDFEDFPDQNLKDWVRTQIPLRELIRSRLSPGKQS